MSRSARLQYLGIRCAVKCRSIEAQETILKVPKAAILCLRNSFDSETAEKLQESGINGMLGVCIAYMYEDSKGEKSRF